ncbi:MAG: TraR/DksA C4-type zinc finger protein [Candidatus Roizmanbacteria bacterium]|nr:TraR/DksA C4-type zinc finger protein [Candidatus Roizmanbacteria bacterium]
MAKTQQYPKELLTDIKAFFLSEKKNAEKRLSQISEEDPYHDRESTTNSADVTVDATEDILHEHATANKSALERKIKEIDMALERVDEGKYGMCKKCDQLINTDRLSSNPFALYCIECASK